MNRADHRRIIELENSVHRLQTEIGRFPLRIASGGAGNDSYGTVWGYVREAASPTDPVVRIWDITLLHLDMPPGVVENQRTDEGTLDCQNLFQQDWQVDDRAVAFEVDQKGQGEEVYDGLANQSAGDLANQDAAGLAGLTAETGTKEERELWWAFKPGAGAGAARAMRTTTTVPVATWDGSRLTLGKGTARTFIIYTADPAVWELDTEDVDVFTMALNEATPPDTNIQCKLVNGLWLIDWEECPPSP